MKGAEARAVKGAKAKKATVRRLKAKRTYYIGIRTYAKVSGKVYHSAWSNVRAVKTK